MRSGVAPLSDKSIALYRRHGLERCWRLLQMPHVGGGEGAQTARRRLADDDPCEPIGGISWRRGEQHRVHDGEHRRVRADAERENRDHRGTGPGAPEYLTQTVSNVLSKTIRPAPDPDATSVLLQECRVAEADSRLAHRLVVRQPTRAIAAGPELDVEPHLLVEVGCQLVPAGELAETPPPFGGFHRGPHTGCRMRSMAPATSRYAATSCSSSRRPSAVIR